MELSLEQDQRISEAIAREQSRLRSFIRRSVPDPGDAEDILQDVFYELVAAYRLMQPVEQVGAWLFRVARNRIIDLFRKKKLQARRSDPVAKDGEALLLDDLLPSPDALFARRPRRASRRATRGFHCARNRGPQLQGTGG